jgi:redox-sensitive bicupin YhaK (pirin superfamily)
MNANKDKEVKFLQIWVIPNKKNVQPRYGQITLDESKMKNNLLQVLSPNENEDGVWIHQDAWFHMGNLEKGFSTTYQFKNKNNGVYTFLLEGNVTINNEQLNSRDGLAITETNEFTISANEKSKLLIMEVPMI